MLRFILFVILLILIVLIGFLFFPVIWIARLFGEKGKKASQWISLWFVQTACRLAKPISGAKLDVKGLENISKDRPVVYLINHRSIFDIILTYPYFKTLTGFVAKKELSKIPIFSYWLKLANGLFLDRQNIREGLKTILKAIDKVKAGTSMCIFPEGTRNKQEDPYALLEFHDASFKLAEKTGADIVPIALLHTADCFENHAPKIKATNVKMTVGAPIHLDDLSKEDRKFIGRYVQNVMTEMMNAYKNEE